MSQKEHGKKQVKKAVCGICASGCPMDVYVEDGKIISVEGSKDRPGQSGGLCAKGAAARQYIYNQERLLYPMKQVGEKGHGKFVRISWEEAYQTIAEKLLSVRERYGARSTIFYAGYPKWYRPALLRLANAYGSPNYCTESSTCFQASNMAWKSIYGNDICFPDLANANTVMLWASNLYHSNTPMSKSYRGMKARGVKIIVVDPRNTVTAREADIHLRLLPGTDGALALGMAQVMIEEDLYDHEFVEKYVHGFEEYRAYVKQFTPEYTEKITGVPAEKILEAARLYATNGPAGIMFSAATVVHHINGVQNYRAVHTLVGLSGNYDRKGGHLARPPVSAPVNEFGKVKRYDGEEAIGQKDFPAWFALPCEEAQCTRLAEYILKEESYPLKALVAFGMNHRMWPKPSYLQEALKKLEFYVNVDLFLSDSSDMADIVLPAATFFEREEIRTMRGGMVGLSEAAVCPCGEAKNDIEIIQELARRMGLSEPVLSGTYEEYMNYILKPTGLSVEELRGHQGGVQAKHLVFGTEKSYEREGFATPTGKAEFVSTVLEKYKDAYGYDGLPVYRDFREVSEVDRTVYPWILNTGSRKPQYFHARVNRLPWLAALEPATLVEMHPSDMESLRIQEGDRVVVTSPGGSMEGIAAAVRNNLPGMVHIYHGNKKGEANELIPLTYLDPISGFPGYKSYFCNVRRKEDEDAISTEI